MKQQHDLALRFLAVAARDEQALEILLDHDAVADETIGFLGQQAAEKLLKALLAERDIEFEKSHSLVYLMQTLEDAGHPLPEPLQELEALTPFAVTFRYDFLDIDTTFDRLDTRSRLKQLRVWVEEQIL